MRMAGIAARLGYKRQEQLLLTESSIPQLEHLMLSSIPSMARNTQLYPLSYIGGHAQSTRSALHAIRFPLIPPHLLSHRSCFDEQKDQRILEITERSMSGWTG
jgi:hypothetical protein